jgi:glycosyltransferase involved in cell wall biosynthesis
VDLALHWTGDWPEHLEPLLAALQDLPEIETAPEGAVVFCPDALAVAPPAADGGRPLVALVPDISALVDPALRDWARGELARWTVRGAILATPTPFGARLLRDLPGPEPVTAARIRELALPLAPGTAPAQWPEGGEDVVVMDPETYRPVLAAARALGVAGLHPRIVLTGGQSEPFVRPGGLAVHYGLLAGRDVIAVEDPESVATCAGAIVLGHAHSGTGMLLRRALATGRPVVAPSSWPIRDHLGALGTTAYLHSGEPDGLVVALGAALRRDRGTGLGAAARAAVLQESWTGAARTLYRSLADALAGEPPAGAPARASGAASVDVAVTGESLTVDVVNLRPSGGGGERFMRSLATAMAGHASRPRVRLICRLDPRVAFDPGSESLRAAGVEVVPVSGADAPDAVVDQLGDADVVYCSWPHGAEPPATETPLVATFHDLNFKHFDVIGAAERAALDAQTPRWIERCRAMIHSSRFIEQELHRFYEVPDGLTHVIALTAERPAGEADAATRAALRARLALGDGPFLLSPNGNHLHKNYPLLLAALRRLRAAGRPVRVLATGFATEIFHGPDLIGLGYVSAGELAALYAECCGVVQTTLYEAGSFPMIEAMAMEKPVAISAIAPVLEQIERLSLRAETFDPLDPPALADALWRLWEGSDATTPDAVAANAAAVLARTWDDVAADYLAVFAAAASAAPVPALV